MFAQQAALLRNWLPTSSPLAPYLLLCYKKYIGKKRALIRCNYSIQGWFVLFLNATVLQFSQITKRYSLLAIAIGRLKSPREQQKSPATVDVEVGSDYQIWLGQRRICISKFRIVIYSVFHFPFHFRSSFLACGMWHGYMAKYKNLRLRQWQPAIERVVSILQNGCWRAFGTKERSGSICIWTRITKHPVFIFTIFTPICFDFSIINHPSYMCAAGTQAVRYLHKRVRQKNSYLAPS